MTRELVELALKPADVEAITPKVIATVVDATAKHLLSFTLAFREQRDLERVKGRKIVLPKIKDIIQVRSDVAPGQTIPASTFSYEGTTLEVAKFGMLLQITNEALEAPVRDLLRDILAEASWQYAVALDKRAGTIGLDIKTGTITSWSGGTLGTTTLVPILEITSVTGATIEAVDYYDGKVLLTGSVPTATVTFTYSDRLKSTGIYLEARDPGTLTAHDVLKLRNELISNTIYPNMLLIHPEDLGNFLYDEMLSSLFIPSIQYEREKLIAPSEIGQLLDLRVLCSGNLIPGACILVDSRRLGFHVIKRGLEGIEEAKPEIDSVHYHLWAESEFGVTDPKAIGLITNIKIGQYKAEDL